jgi:tetratricopeptide (TPR) repeat protein
MWDNFIDGTKFDDSSLLRALFYTGKIKKLTNKLDEAYKTLNEVHELMRSNELHCLYCLYNERALMRRYPVVYVETNLMLAEICVAQDKTIEACSYLKQGITVKLSEDFNIFYMYKIIFRLLKTSIDHYVPNTEMRKKDHVIFNDFLGRYYFKAENYQTAYEAFARALELVDEVHNDSLKSPQELKLHQGHCKIKLKEYQEAFDIF